MIALAMLKAEVPPSDPRPGRLPRQGPHAVHQQRVRPRAGQRPGAYEAGATAMALASQDPVANRGYLVDDRHLPDRPTRTPTGAGTTPAGTHGDTSITQYAVLGLWEAENAGVDVSPVVWERVASWFMSVQFGDGSWNLSPGRAAATRRDASR